MNLPKSIPKTRENSHPEESKTLQAEPAITQRLLDELEKYSQLEAEQFLQKIRTLIPLQIPAKTPENLKTKITFLLEKLLQFDWITFVHSFRVAELSLILAQEIKIKASDFANLPPKDQTFFSQIPNGDFQINPKSLPEIYCAALTHDIGKIYIPEHKPLNSQTSIPSLPTIQSELERQKTEIINEITQTCDQTQAFILILLAESIPAEQQRPGNLELAITTHFNALISATLSTKQAARDLPTEHNRLLKILAKYSNLESHHQPPSKQDFEEMKKHTITGQRLLQALEMPNIYQDAALDHHQTFKPDQSKSYPFPDKSAQEISFIGRLLRLADIFEALTGIRGYKAPYSIEKASAILESEKELFDPIIFQSFQTLQNSDSENLFQNIEILYRILANFQKQIPKLQILKENFTATPNPELIESIQKAVSTYVFA